MATIALRLTGLAWAIVAAFIDLTNAPVAFLVGGAGGGCSPPSPSQPR